MPPRASHRLDVLLVSQNIEHVPDNDAFLRIRARWEAAGRLTDGTLLRGGFRRLWLDLPGRTVLYANQQGGYYVRCPVSGDNIARLFSTAVQAWRAGGERLLHCTGCGQPHPLEAVTLSPPGAFARGAVIFSSAGSLELAEDVQTVLLPVLGPSHVLFRRVA